MTQLSFATPRFLFLLGLLLLLPLAYRFTLAQLQARRFWLALVTRSAFVISLVAILAQPTLRVAKTNVATAFIVDTSASISDAELQRAADLYARAQAAKPAGDDLFLVGFGDHATRLDAIVANGKPNRVDPQGSDLKAALTLADGLFADDKLKRAVLFSDGNETENRALDVVPALRQRGVHVDTIAAAQDAAPEVLIESVRVPTEVKVGDAFDVTADVFSSVAQDAVVTLSRDSVAVADGARQIHLLAGANHCAWVSKVSVAGIHTFSARLSAATAAPLKDRFSNNNQAAATTRALGAPRVLYAEGTLPSAGYLQAALHQGGIDVDVVGPTGLPTSEKTFESYDLVILSDIAASFTGEKQLAALDDYVRNHGGGLLVAGGENSFGAGGYGNTPIEKLLPVHFAGEKKRDEPALALALCIDRSGSMSGDKIELAKDAAKATAELLGADDLLAVIAFDAEAYPIVRLTRAANRLRINNDISRLVASGGTNILPALREAYEELAPSAAKIKHVIVLTDGQANYDGIAEQVDRMVAAKMTVSAVGVGDGADKTLLTMIAERGGGRFYFTEDAHNIPRIFMKETKEIARSSIVEQAGVARVSKAAEVLGGIDFSHAPALRGYVSATQKPLSELLLSTAQGEPLLVRWRLGLGQVVVFTSDVKNRWAVDWIRWSGYAQLFNQLVRGSMRQGSARGTVVPMSVRVEAPWVEASIDAMAKDDKFLSGLDVTLHVTRADGNGNDLETRASNARWGEAREASPNEGGRESPPVVTNGNGNDLETRASNARWGEAREASPNEGGREGPPVVTNGNGNDLETRASNARWGEAREASPNEGGRESPPVVTNGNGNGVSLGERAPALYEGRFRLAQTGLYDLRADLRRDGVLVAEAFGHINVPYSAEYLPRPTNDALLAALSRATGGKSEPGPAQFFDTNGEHIDARRPLWPFLCWLSILLLLFDVLVRRFPQR